MAVVLVSQVLVAVSHVLAGVDVEELLLLVLDVEKVALNLALVLSQVGSHNWSVHGGAP